MYNSHDGVYSQAVSAFHKVLFLPYLSVSNSFIILLLVAFVILREKKNQILKIYIKKISQLRGFIQSFILGKIH